MKSSMKRFADDAASKSTTDCGLKPMRLGSARGSPFLRSVPFLLSLVEEAAALKQARPLFGGDLDVARRQQEDLVGDALHAAVEGIREPAREVDQPLRQLLVGPLQVEDDRDAVLEAIRDLLGVLKGLRNDEMHT